MKNHLQTQEHEGNRAYAAGSRSHVLSEDVAVRYVVCWRVEESFRRLIRAARGAITFDSKLLVLCSGEGMEGSILSDMGFTDVTVSDVAERGVHAALNRDRRLKGLRLNAESTNLTDDSYDVVLVQDGLHHLSSPVQGLTEQLRVARKAVVFLEPHDSLVGRLAGTKWEKKGAACNYVFRWNIGLVEKVASSYLGQDRFINLSYSFWHHNTTYAKISKVLGSSLGLSVIKAVKVFLDTTVGRYGNQFCGLVIKQ